MFYNSYSCKVIIGFIILWCDVARRRLCRVVVPAVIFIQQLLNNKSSEVVVLLL